MKTKNRIMALMLIFFLVFSNLKVVNAYEIRENAITLYTINDAEKVAIQHIRSIMSVDKPDIWKNGVRISERKALFDFNNNINSYYFQLENYDGDVAGYVITGATSETYPIIEYSDTGESFISIAIDTISEERQIDNSFCKIYRSILDNTYACKVFNDNEGKIYDISDAYFCELGEKDLQYSENIVNNYADVWNEYIHNYNTGDSNAPDNEGDGFIFNPVLYESGYNLSSYFSLVTDRLQFKDMTDFSSGAVCSPTAAVNLCIYWADKNEAKYGKLKFWDSWNESFWYFYSLMETDLTNGTKENKIAGAYQEYFMRMGLSCDANFHEHTNNGQDIVEELDCGRPVHLMLHDHYKYKNHSVIALGYMQFRYDDYDSIYIRIADGWSRTANRYVWGMCYGTWNYVSVEV